MNITRLDKLSKLVSSSLKRKPKILIDPKDILRITGNNYNQNIDFNMDIDVDEWILNEKLQKEIANISADRHTNIEEKILNIYQKLCEDYTYDDNVLSYIKKYEDDSFGLPDFYGRNTTEKWKENRTKHNRRNCYEISRLLAQSIKELIKNAGISSNYDVCILWDEALTHYFVGLTSNEYCVTLDLDDFNQIKDLTRMKTGLTLEGVRVLEDTNGKFTNVLQKINKGRSSSAQEHIENKREIETEKENKTIDSDETESDDYKFLKFAIETLVNDYNLDSQGLFEYMKEIVDTKIGPATRKKVWKQIDVDNGDTTVKRYTRCLVINIDDSNYVIDVEGKDIDSIFYEIDENMMAGPDSTFIPYKQLNRPWDEKNGVINEEDRYDGR